MNCPHCGNPETFRRETDTHFLLNMNMYTIAKVTIFNCRECMHEFFILKGTEPEVQDGRNNKTG